MKGIIFQLVRQAVEEQLGQETWEDLLEDVGSDGVFAAHGDYPDEALEAVIAAACSKLGTDRESLLVTLGQWTMPHLAKAYSGFFEQHNDLRGFLRSIHDVIHVEVRRLYRDAEPPHFEYEDAEDGALDLLYRSKRDMSALAEGFILGAAPMFDESVSVERAPEDDAVRLRVRGLR